MSITEFSQEMTAAVVDFNDNLPCDIMSENTQQTTATLTTQNALTWEIVPNIIKIKHEHELPTAPKLHDEMVRKFTKLEIDVKRLRNESKDLKSKLEKKTMDLEKAEEDAMMWKMCCNYSGCDEIAEPEKLHDRIMAHIRAEQKELISQYKKKIMYMVQKKRENEKYNIQSTNTSLAGKATPSKYAPLKGSKRKRTLLEESEEHSNNDNSVTGTAKDDVEIVEV